jgi:hypothetical protein
MVYNYNWSSTYAVAVLESDQRKLSERLWRRSLLFCSALASLDWQDVSGEL